MSGRIERSTTAGEAARAMIGRHFYRARIGFGRVVRCDLVWGNYAHLTVRLTDGRLVCPVKGITV